MAFSSRWWLWRYLLAFGPWAFGFSGAGVSLQRNRINWLVKSQTDYVCLSMNFHKSKLEAIEAFGFSVTSGLVPVIRTA